MLEDEIRKVVNASLDRAENHWDNVGVSMLSVEESSVVFDSAIEKSDIPNHPFVSDDISTVDDFIALVADMRNSSKHLDDGDIGLRQSNLGSGIQRVFYETSALLPALAKTIKLKKGTVTEFLGDGVLALFPCEDENINTIITSYKAGKDIVCDTRDIVNEILSERYYLPEIDIGVGLSRSKAIVNLVGLEGQKQAKAFGKCVFNATKLSTGKNKVLIDRSLNNELNFPSVIRARYGFNTGSLKRMNDDISYFSLKIPEKEKFYW